MECGGAGIDVNPEPAATTHSLPSPHVHSAEGDVINHNRSHMPGHERFLKSILAVHSSVHSKGARLFFPPMSSSVVVGPLVGWMLALTVKHVIADFLLQNSWMALGKDQKTGWALPLLTHCTIHGVLTTLIVVLIEPRLWFLGLVDFVIHICIDRAKGICVSTFHVTMDHPWFWWLIGIDQALHHLTGFALSIFATANG